MTKPANALLVILTKVIVKGFSKGFIPIKRQPVLSWLISGFFVFKTFILYTPSLSERTLNIDSVWKSESQQMLLFTEGSSNGRTTGSGPGNPGSNPGPSAI